MKKFIAIITLVSMLSLAGCGEKTESSTESAASTASSVSEESTAEESSAEESSEEVAEAAPVNEEDYFDWFGVKMYYPESDMIKDETEHRRTSHIYDKDSDEYNEIYTLYTVADENNPEIPVSEVQKDEYLLDGICGNINLCLSCDSSFSEFKPESEEKVEILGKEFIKQKGTFKAEGNDDPVELTYCCYFGLMDFKENNYTNCPTMWIALSELNDDATKAQLEKRVDTAAQNMEYLK